MPTQCKHSSLNWTAKLHLGDSFQGESSGVVPVILVKGVLDGDDGVVLAEVLVHLHQLWPEVVQCVSSAHCTVPSANE
jgi:hypothetical protein